MSERKVLNKYYPPEFDPSKIPKLHLARNRQFSIRIMAPFNMRCNTCGEYIYKGKKFNSRKETVEDEDYLGLRIHRFYIKCPRCVAEIAFKTDPENTDYALEAGATRNFEALRTAEILAEKEKAEKDEEEKNNPMKVLENRTKASRQEMDMLETLEDLRELNSRHAKVDHKSMLELHRAYEAQLQKLMVEEEEDLIKSMFGKTSEGMVKRIHDDDEEEDAERPIKTKKMNKPTDLLHQAGTDNSKLEKKSGGGLVKIGVKLKNKSGLSGLVRPKKTNSSSTSASTSVKTTTAETVSAATGTSETVKKSLAETSTAVSSATDSSLKSAPEQVASASVKPLVAPTASLGLGLLGGYSGSSDNSGDTDSD